MHLHHMPGDLYVEMTECHGCANGGNILVIYTVRLSKVLPQILWLVNQKRHAHYTHHLPLCTFRLMVSLLCQ
jgi:hypothetical protein